MCLNISTPERSLTPDYDSTMSLEASSSRQCTCDHSEAFDDVLKYVGKLRESHSQLEEHFKNLNASYQRDYSLLFEDLKDLQNRRESLEERFIDLTEQYQNDVWNLKKELAATAEKSADRSSDATQDFYEVLEACERRQFKLEQQQQKEEDAGHPETWANTTAQTVLEKLIDVSLAFITVLLVLMSTVSSWVAPFFKTALLMLCTLLFLVLLSFLWRHWDVILDYHHLPFCN
ncbi:transmembrane and coiled-coil domains protein 1-like isoform X1 [Neolamprologus brichardi]|uniref:transmembrane and coiled-coil domains protein 1-like isoform X1 n=1 Tax=Neolamprologus brichardi TaxID=32507 RepID=UPI0003EC5884|nr:transmembrane and coiled-coil domains protein 1-like isoform X1 [Neolamprologus brichardi]